MPDALSWISLGVGSAGLGLAAYSTYRQTVHDRRDVRVRVHFQGDPRQRRHFAYVVRVVNAGFRPVEITQLWFAPSEVGWEVLHPDRPLSERHGYLTGLEEIGDSSLPRVLGSGESVELVRAAGLPWNDGEAVYEKVIVRDNLGAEYETLIPY